MTVESHSIMYICIANVHSIVIFCYFLFSFQYQHLPTAFYSQTSLISLLYLHIVRLHFYRFNSRLIMGGKLTKSKVNEQQKNAAETTTTTEPKKKVEKTKNKKKKSSILKVDKSTNTESCILPTTAFAEQLVGEPIPTNVTIPIEIINETVLPSEDVVQFREVCSTNEYESMKIEDEEEAAARVSSMITIINTNNEQQQQQPQSVES